MHAAGVVQLVENIADLPVAVASTPTTLPARGSIPRLSASWVYLRATVRTRS